MQLRRYFHSSVLISALLVLSGCHYPAAIKSASAQMKVQTADLTKLYANDLSALRERLDDAGKALDATRDELASARASQKVLADRLVATHYALQMSRAMQQFDLGALNLLSRDFDDAFHKVYLGRLQPKVDELKNQRNAAEKAYQADRGNNALLKEYAVATGRLQAVQTACMEDYRLLYLDFVTRVVQTRQEVVNRISTNAPPGALLDAGAAPDYQALLHPKEVAAPPALPDLA